MELTFAFATDDGKILKKTTISEMLNIMLSIEFLLKRANL